MVTIVLAPSPEPRWVELFFPGSYDFEEDSFDSYTERYWKRSDVLVLPEQVELKVHCKEPHEERV